MKRILKRIIMGFIVVLCCLNMIKAASAAGSVQSKDGEYEYWVSGSTSCMITKYLGKETELVIPGEFDGYKVTAIGTEAFANCSSLVSVSLPEGVTTIGEQAFAHCKNLTTVSLPEGLTRIGNAAFQECTNLSTIDLPESVTDLNGDVFSFTSLKSIVIPKGVTEIKSCLFSGCSNLVSVTLPEGLTKIGGSAFDSCSNLTSIKIPEGVTSIGDSAFYECSRLSSISLPESLISIEDYAFRECCNLKNINIPEGVTIIGRGVFWDCTSLVHIEIPAGVSKIEENVFNNCTSLTDIVLPEGLTSIGVRAFFECGSLSDIKLPETLTSIGDYAFSGCSSLSNINLSEGLTSIGNYAFSRCSKINRITLPAGLTNCGSNQFVGCSNLYIIVNNSTFTIKDTETWRDMEGNLYTKEIPPKKTVTNQSVYTDEEYQYKVVDETGKICQIVNYLGTETRLDIPETLGGYMVNGIGDYAFYNCSELRSVIIPAGVTSIGSYAFCNCSGLSRISISDKITHLGYEIFDGCSGLQYIYNNSNLSIGVSGTWYDMEKNLYIDKVPAHTTVMSEEIYLNSLVPAENNGGVSLQYKKSANGKYTIRLIYQITLEEAQNSTDVGVLYEGRGRRENLLGNALYASFVAAGVTVRTDEACAYSIIQIRNVPEDAVFEVTPIIIDRSGNTVTLNYEKYEINMAAIVSK